MKSLALVSMLFSMFVFTSCANMSGGQKACCQKKADHACCKNNENCKNGCKADKSCCNDSCKKCDGKSSCSAGSCEKNDHQAA